MLRTSHTISIENVTGYKQAMFAWAQQFREIVFLDSNEYPQKYSSFDCMLAVDAFTSIKTDHHNAFDTLNQYQQTTKDWLFGYLSYDLKNDIENLNSNSHDGLDFPELYFFQPKKIFLIKGNQLEMHYLNLCAEEMESDLKEIDGLRQFKSELETTPQPFIRPRISKDAYLQKVGLMLEHIHRGDIYEANFCMEFFAEDAVIDPTKTFRKLNAISNPPFAAFFKNFQHFAMSASPERFLRKQETKIVSQPIKGTARRAADPHEDNKIQCELQANEKERAENIMIVDLVRNDLSRTAVKGSVAVEELCEPYAFKQVHHLISTVVSEAKLEYSPVDIIKNAFPMGSMTGAPKISAMQIIEKLEETKRGLYSGAIGYFSPVGDFDFNVVIRSILYNSASKYLSFSVGSAITAEATAEMEFEECMLKAKAMFAVFEKEY